jgi:hypothetical protein
MVKCRRCGTLNRVKVRRGYEIIKRQRNFTQNSLKDQWMEYFSKFPESWKELFGLINFIWSKHYKSLDISKYQNRKN